MGGRLKIDLDEPRRRWPVHESIVSSGLSLNQPADREFLPGDSRRDS